MLGPDSKRIFPAGHLERATAPGDSPVTALGATAGQAAVNRLLLSQDAAADGVTSRYGGTGGGTAGRSPLAVPRCLHEDSGVVRGRSCPGDAVPRGGRSVTSAQGDAGCSVCLPERDGDVEAGQTRGVQKPQQSPEHAVPPAWDGAAPSAATAARGPGFITVLLADSAPRSLER